MILHTVNKPPANSVALSSCLQVIGQGDTLLLIENGVYAAIAGSEGSESIERTQKIQHCTIAVLEADVLARGISGNLNANIKTVDDRDFVKLAAMAKLVQSWY